VHRYPHIIEAFYSEKRNHRVNARMFIVPIHRHESKRHRHDVSVINQFFEYHIDKSFL
jgi:hypothetical protein